MSEWFLKRNGANIELMAESLNINPVTACVLANRGVRTQPEALDFLYPGRKNLPDPSGLMDMEKAVKTVYEAVSAGKLAAVYGDYDADGIISTYMLYNSLAEYGADVIYYMPHREYDGYGLNMKAVDSLYGRGVNMIISCDNGVSAHEEIAYAKRLGMDVVVIDHHDIVRMPDESGKMRGVLPDADAIINPKREDCRYSCKTLCAAALCYKFLKYFHQYLELEFENEDEMLALAAIASVCDVVDMTSETRAIVSRGLNLLNSGKINNGLDALITKTGLNSVRMDTAALGYVIGPCLNAAGRLDSAGLSVELLLAEGEKADALAERLIELNEERKALTAKGADRALAAISDKETLDNVIVYFDDEIHESLAGIVAGRIRETVNRPAIVLTRSGELVKGSARSVEGYSIYGGLSEFRELFVKFGGHDMAAGFTLKAENVETLRKGLNKRFDPKDAGITPVYNIEKEIKLSDITFELAHELRRLEPYGPGNQVPLFGTKGLMPEVCEIIGESRRTLRFTFITEDRKRKIKAICFNRAEDFVKMISSRFASAVIDGFLEGKIKNLRIFLDIIYYIEINEYNGNEYLQIRIEDFREALEHDKRT